MPGRHHVALAPLLAALLACGEDGPTTPDVVGTIPVSICDQDDWFAYQNEGGRWTRVVPRDGRLEFMATERLAIAIAILEQATPYLNVDYMTAAQVNALYGCHGPQPVSTQTANGVVRGLAEFGQAQVTFGDAYGRFVHAAEPTFLIPVFPGDHDLVATRSAGGSAGQAADRMILRRTQSYTAGADVEIDFASAEAFPLVASTLRFTGPGTWVLGDFSTENVRTNDLTALQIGELQAPEMPFEVTLYSVPASRLQSGDVHGVLLWDFGFDRRVELFYHAPRDLTASFGPIASVPNFTTTSTSGAVRVIAEVPAQAEYDASVWIHYGQSNPLRSVRVTATREYFRSTPATWALPMPDLRGVDGFESWLLLHPGAFTWSLHVTSRPFGFRRGDASDGQVMRTASAAGVRP